MSPAFWQLRNNFPCIYAGIAIQHEAQPNELSSLVASLAELEYTLNAIVLEFIDSITVFLFVKFISTSL